MSTSNVPQMRLQEWLAVSRPVDLVKRPADWAELIRAVAALALICVAEPVLLGNNARPFYRVVLILIAIFAITMAWSVGEVSSATKP